MISRGPIVNNFTIRDLSKIKIQ